MKKFFLYFLFFLLIAGLAVLAFGFYNAKRVRTWASAAEEIKARHDISNKENSIKSGLDASGGKKIEDNLNDLEKFASELDTISGEMKSADEKTKKLGGPSEVRQTRDEISRFYEESEAKINGLSNIVKFKKQLLDIIVIFDRMNTDTTLEEIKSTIAEAKTKSSEIRTDLLPADVVISANDLKKELDNFLDAVQQRIDENNESSGSMNLSSDSFSQISQKESVFLSDSTKYNSSLNALDPESKQIDAHLMILERVRFSIR